MITVYGWRPAQIWAEPTYRSDRMEKTEAEGLELVRSEKKPAC
jgi:hypothetical protein